MLSYDMNGRGELPLYEYLYRRIRDDILSGDISADDRLPSKRKLAEHLGISLITVEGAYRQLLAEGFIYTLPRRGFYANRLPQKPQVLSAASIVSARPAPESDTSTSQSQPSPLVADFSRPTMRTSSPAGRLWSKALRGTLSKEPQSELYGPCPSQGSPRLAKAIAKHLSQSRGMDVDPECIVIGSGAQVLYTYVSLLFGQDATIALEDPGYPRLGSIYKSLGHHIVATPMDEDGIDVACLAAKGASIAHVMPSHQFPTGRVMSIQRRYELLSWAATEGNRYIVEDDYDWEFRFAGMPIPSLASIDASGKVIYISTFSKSLSSALRMAFAVLPPKLMEVFKESLGFMAGTVSAIDQITLANLIESGEYERHLNRYKKQSKTVRDSLVSALRNSALGSRIKIKEADSGLHFVLEIETGKSEEEIAAEALVRGVRLAPLSRYAFSKEMTKDSSASFVMQYDGLDPHQIPAVIAVLEAAA